MVVLTCFHGRPKVSEIFLAHTTPRLPIFAACSEGDTENIALCQRYGVTFCVVANEPLGAKWNAAMELVPEGTPVMVLGSDDLVSDEWIAAAQGSIDAGHHYITPAACGMYDMASGAACILRSNGNGSQTFGAGRVLSATVVAAVRPMWTAEKMQALDSDAHGRILGHGFERVTMATDRVPVTDLKSGVNLWAYHTWAWRGRPAAVDDVLHMLAPGLRQASSTSTE
jgi:hypothetical protein